MQDFKALFDVAQKLKTKKDGKVLFNIPNAGEMSQVISKTESIVSNLKGLLKFAQQKEEKFPALKTLPVKTSDVDKVASDLKTVQNLPFS